SMVRLTATSRILRTTLTNWFQKVLKAVCLTRAVLLPLFTNWLAASVLPWATAVANPSRNCTPRLSSWKLQLRVYVSPTYMMCRSPRKRLTTALTDLSQSLACQKPPAFGLAVFFVYRLCVVDRGWSQGRRLLRPGRGRGASQSAPVSRHRQGHRCTAPASGPPRAPAQATRGSDREILS